MKTKPSKFDRLGKSDKKLTLTLALKFGFPEALTIVYELAVARGWTTKEIADTYGITEAGGIYKWDLEKAQES